MWVKTRWMLGVSYLALAWTISAQGSDAGNAVAYGKALLEVEPLIRAGLRKQALPQLEMLAKMNSQDGDVQYQLAMALAEAERHREAIPHFEAALKLGAFVNKFEANAHYDLACCYAKIGEKESAFKKLQLAIDLGFRDIAHVRSDSDLESLRTDKRWTKLTASDDVTKMTRDQGWRYDLWFANRELRRIHLNPYRFHSAKAFDDHVERLQRDIPRLKDEQIVAGLQKLFAMAGDGHTGLRPANGSPMLRQLPIQTFWFEEGLFITSAAPPQARIVGQEVVAIDGVSVTEAAKKIEPFISRDNDMNFKATFGSRFPITPLMFGAGISKSPDRATLTLRDAEGKSNEVVLEAGTAAVASDWAHVRQGATHPEPLYLKHRQTNLYMERLPALNAMYVQYNAVRDAEVTVLDFSKRLFETMDAENIQRLIIDVRWNGGGNTFLSRPLHDGIMRRERLNQRGNLFLITGRNTFSAAQNFTTDITRFSNPILVGEPTGSSPNFVGETVRIVLPYSKVTASISDLYWQRSWPMDHRQWLAPHLPAPPTLALYRENRDPAMEAIFAFLR